MKIKVFDKQKNQYADAVELAKFYGIFYVQAGFAVNEDGTPMVCSFYEYQYLDETRYEVRFEPDYTALLSAARKTITENMHLADGENCTLRELRDAVEMFDGVTV